MREEFAARRGYDLTPYLPTLLSLTMTKQEIAKKAGLLALIVSSAARRRRRSSKPISSGRSRSCTATYISR